MRIPNIPKDVFVICLPWPPKNHSFIFNNKFYKQIDGVAMGPPLGPALINIFMCSFENNGSIIACLLYMASWWCIPLSIKKKSSKNVYLPDIPT